MAKKAAKRRVKADDAPKVEKYGAVRYNCASSEVMLALRAYGGGVSSGLAIAPRSAARTAKLKELKENEIKLVSIQRRMSQASDQSNGVIVIFNKDLDRFSTAAFASGRSPLKKGK